MKMEIILIVLKEMNKKFIIKNQKNSPSKEISKYNHR